MRNIVTTIPKNKFKDWTHAERVCRKCDGTTLWFDGNGDKSEWYWLINTAALPTKIVPGESVCYMIFDGQIRGYFDIVGTNESKNWTRHDESLALRQTKCIIMANWHPCPPMPQRGFQGYRYTDLRP